LTEVSAPQPLMLIQALNWLQQRVPQPITSALGSMSAAAVHTPQMIVPPPFPKQTWTGESTVGGRNVPLLVR
jgi:hypothetical protein